MSSFLRHYIPGQPQSLPGMQNLQDSLRQVATNRFNRAKLQQDWEMDQAQHRANADLQAQEDAARVAAAKQKADDERNAKLAENQLKFEDDLRAAKATGVPEEVLRMSPKGRMLGYEIRQENMVEPPTTREDDIEGWLSGETNLEGVDAADAERETMQSAQEGRVSMLDPLGYRRTWSPQSVQHERERVAQQSQEAMSELKPSNRFEKLRNEKMREAAPLAAKMGLKGKEAVDFAANFADKAASQMSQRASASMRAESFDKGRLTRLPEWVAAERDHVLGQVDKKYNIDRYQTAIVGAEKALALLEDGKRSGFKDTAVIAEIGRAMYGAAQSNIEGGQLRGAGGLLTRTANFAQRLINGQWSDDYAGQVREMALQMGELSEGVLKRAGDEGYRMMSASPRAEARAYAPVIRGLISGSDYAAPEAIGAEGGGESQTTVTAGDETPGNRELDAIMQEGGQ